MRANERYIIAGVATLALVIAFWVLILGPKRNEAAALGEDVTTLKNDVSKAEQQAEFAQQARSEFPKNYGKLVVLGKAVPQDADSASFLVQLNHVAQVSGVDFRSLELSDNAAAPAPAAPAQPGIENAPPSTSQPSTEQGQPTAAGGGTATQATEATASTLAIGAGVGPAGLSTLKYDLGFTGDFFHVADFIHDMDKLISTSGGKVAVNGRLTTIDGFSLTADPNKGFPNLVASFLVTTYLTPPEQGLTGGASPAGPAPVTPGQPQLQPASAGATP
jgi:hypothetical protein